MSSADSDVPVEKEDFDSPKLKKLIAIMKAKQEKKAQKEKEKKKKKFYEYKNRWARKKRRHERRLKNDRERKRLWIAKRRAAEREEFLKKKKAAGDTRMLCTIIITCNGKFIERVFVSQWRLPAYHEYARLIEENEKNVIFGKKCEIKKSGVKNLKYSIAKLKYEMLITKNASKQETEEGSMIKNELGKYTKNVVVCKRKNKVILEKHSWKVPELFDVYGRGLTDGRTFYDEVLMKDASKSNVKRLFVFRNRVIVIDGGGNTDVATCCCDSEAFRLYDSLKEALPKRQKEILLQGILGENHSDWIYDYVSKRTGWSEEEFNAAPDLRLMYETFDSNAKME